MNLFEDNEVREYCPVHRVAQYLNVTPRYIQVLARRGIIPRPRKGEYDLLGCVHAYLNYFKRMVNFYVTHSRKLSFLEQYRPPHQNYVYQKSAKKLNMRDTSLPRLIEPVFPCENHSRDSEQ